MPDVCNSCGVSALDNERFAEESLPFRGTRRYCLACRQKLYRKVFATLAVVPVVFACLGAYNSFRQHTPLLDSIAIQWFLLVAFQWLMILPHELGHAFAARVMGFANIRILVGAGRPLLVFSFFGFPTLINLIPFGGVTLCKPSGSRLRRRWLVVIGAGLLVNLAAAMVAWPFVAPGELLSLHSGSVATPFFMANAVVFIGNIVPYRIVSPYGPLMSDGLQLLTLLFRWNKPVAVQRAEVPTWLIGIQKVLKWALALVLMVGALLFVAVTGVVLFRSHNPESSLTGKLLSPVLILCAFVAGWAAVRVAKHPVGTTTGHASTGAADISKSMTQEQKEFLIRANERIRQRDLSGAEALLDQAIALCSGPEVPCYWSLRQLKMQYIVAQNDFARAERVSLEWFDQAGTIERKVNVLDGFSSCVLYKSASACMDSAERLARKAVELAPGSLTVKGTLGAILVEQGRIAEGEPLLQECLKRSPAFHDQGIAALYLGIAKLSKGERREARRLLKRCMVLHSQPWLVKKAVAALKSLDE